MQKKIKVMEFVKIDANELRKYCTERSLYTGGSIEGYLNLLKRVDNMQETVTPEILLEYAMEILDNSPQMEHTLASLDTILYGINKYCVARAYITSYAI